MCSLPRILRSALSSLLFDQTKAPCRSHLVVHLDPLGSTWLPVQILAHPSKPCVIVPYACLTPFETILWRLLLLHILDDVTLNILFLLHDSGWSLSLHPQPVIACCSAGKLERDCMVIIYACAPKSEGRTSINPAQEGPKDKSVRIIRPCERRWCRACLNRLRLPPCVCIPRLPISESP